MLPSRELTSPTFKGKFGKSSSTQNAIRMGGILLVFLEGFFHTKFQYDTTGYGYPPVNKHSNGKSPSWIGNTSSNGGFSIAMLDYSSVYQGMTTIVCFPIYHPIRPVLLLAGSPPWRWEVCPSLYASDFIDFWRQKRRSVEKVKQQTFHQSARDDRKALKSLASFFPGFLVSCFYFWTIFDFWKSQCGFCVWKKPWFQSAPSCWIRSSLPDSYSKEMPSERIPWNRWLSKEYKQKEPRILPVDGSEIRNNHLRCRKPCK